MKSFTFEAIGTAWSIDMLDDISFEKQKQLEKEIKDRIEVFDKTYSRFRSDSVVTQISKKSGEYKLPQDAKILFDLYKKLYQITDGAFTPLIGNVLADAGYDAEYSLTPRTLHRPDTWEHVLEYKSPILNVKHEVILDFGAAGKGYLVDIIGEIFEKHHVQAFCIDGSGDILYKSSEPKVLRIGLEHPENPKQAIGVASISSGSLCGSAGNRRTWGNFHHIINPHTLQSPKDITAVWVTAETAILADALTTCLYFVTPQTLQKHFSFEYVMLKADLTIKKSQDFPGEFFYN